MYHFEKILEKLVAESKLILGDNLVGVYLHGSAAMNCFHESKSDLDVLVVIKHNISTIQKRKYMDMIVMLNQKAPAKGIEFSMLLGSACNPFVYPTPFVLHFSQTHLSWYNANPEDYINKMHGTDTDLAAHITILSHRGKTLYGQDISSVFAEVPVANYWDSIWNDIKDARQNILDSPMYVILNLCRVYAYKKDHLILSKNEGGQWGLKNLPIKYTPLISDALADYSGGPAMTPHDTLALEFVNDMLTWIQFN